MGFAMKLAVRTTKLDAVKLQLISLLQLSEKGIVTTASIYRGITLIEIDHVTLTTLNSIRNIEAILLDEATAEELLKPSTRNDAPSLKSLDGVHEPEHYEHLSQLLHMQKAMRDKK